MNQRELNKRLIHSNVVIYKFSLLEQLYWKISQPEPLFTMSVTGQQWVLSHDYKKYQGLLTKGYSLGSPWQYNHCVVI